MKIADIRNLPDDELVAEIGKARQKIFKLGFQAKGAPVESPGALKSTRKDVARMLTVLREREIAKKQKAAAATPGTEKSGT